jgi:hypothetical protein
MSIIYCRVSTFYPHSDREITTLTEYTTNDTAINSRYAVVITRHQTQSEEPGASAADVVQDADTVPEPLPAEPTTPSTAALRSAGGEFVSC